MKPVEPILVVDLFEPMLDHFLPLLRLTHSTFTKERYCW